MAVGQIVTLYTLRVYGAACQLHLSKAGRKQRRDQRASAYRTSTMGGDGEDGVRKPERGPRQTLNLPVALISAVQPPTLWEGSVCCLSPSCATAAPQTRHPAHVPQHSCSGGTGKAHLLLPATPQPGPDSLRHRPRATGSPLPWGPSPGTRGLLPGKQEVLVRHESRSPVFWVHVHRAHGCHGVAATTSSPSRGPRSPRPCRRHGSGPQERLVRGSISHLPDPTYQ